MKNRGVVQFQVLNKAVKGLDQPLQGTFHQGFGAWTQILQFSISRPTGRPGGQNSKFPLLPYLCRPLKRNLNLE